MFVSVNGMARSYGTAQDGLRRKARTESGDGGVTGACNQYGFAFSNLAIRSDYKGAWQAFELSRVLRDPDYQMWLRPSAVHRFVAVPKLDSQSTNNAHRR
jgi:hypothetical protein